MSQTRMLESAVDALDVALLVISAERKIAFANAAAHRLFGLPHGQLLGDGVERLVSPERRAELRNLDEVLSGGSARKVRSVLRRDDGSRVDVTMVLEPCLDDKQQVTGVSVRYYDAPQNSLRPGQLTSRPPLGMPPEGGSSAFGSSQPAPSLSAPSPRSSQSRLSPAGASAEQQRVALAKLVKSLHWLHERLSLSPTIAPLDDARERARALLMVADALSTAEQAQAALSPDDIPAAPRVPRL